MSRIGFETAPGGVHVLKGRIHILKNVSASRAVKAAG
jgi:hypothetical protein